jgi:hypothetical protein
VADRLGARRGAGAHDCGAIGGITREDGKRGDITSMPSRISEDSHTSRMCSGRLSRPACFFVSESILKPNFVAITTWSRIGFTAGRVGPQEYRRLAESKPLTLQGSEYPQAVHELNKAIDRAEGLLVTNLSLWKMPLR